MLRFYSKLLVLFVLFEIIFGFSGSPVKFLPGFEGPLPFELETGYIGVGEGDEVQLYYLFFKSESNPKNDPLILWITGGPGCSALSGIIHEIGPVISDYLPYNGSLPTLSLNPYAFTKVASIIFIDLPVGTGFSYATTSKANHSDNLQTGHHAYQFLRRWLIDHQEYPNHAVYIAGDSYSGITVPIVTQMIFDGTEMGIKPRINLKGYILGNPKTIDAEDFYKIPFAHGMGLISDELYKSLVLNCGEDFLHITPTNESCLRDFSTLLQLIKGIERHQILEPTCDVVLDDSRRLLGEKFQKLKSPAALNCRDDWLAVSKIWANDHKVKDALHVRKDTVGVWERCNFNLSFTRVVNNTIPYHAYLSRKGLRSLIYSGDHDTMVPFISTQAWIKSLNYSIVDEWRPWIVDGQVAGYTRRYSNQMTFVTIKGGGHNAPEYKPRECLAIVERWLSYAPI